MIDHFATNLALEREKETQTDRREDGAKKLAFIASYYFD